MIKKWKVLKSTRLFESDWFNLRKDVCKLPSGLTLPDYYVGESPDYCMVVALTKKGRILLAREYKHAVREVILQLPAGYVDPKDRGHRRAVLRELEEETGWVPGCLRYLGAFFPSPGRLDNRMHLYEARDLKPGRRHLDLSEDLELMEATPSQCLSFVRRGLIQDQASALAILLYLSHKKNR